jgi:hypothetical protein
MSTEQPVCYVNPKRQLFAAEAEARLQEAKRAIKLDDNSSAMVASIPAPKMIPVNGAVLRVS